MSPRLRTWTLYVSLWLLMVLLYWTLLVLQTNGSFRLEMFVAAMRLSAVPAVLGTFVWLLTARVPWPEARIAAFASIHAVCAVSFACILAWWFTRPLLHGVGGVSREIVLRSILPWQVATGLFMYGLVAGVSYAIRGGWGARDLRRAAERAEHLQAQAELAALRAHINPHFLFNTLHSVTQLLRSDPPRAEAALERLSDLFRYALRLDRQRVEVVSLEEEWRFSESYLWLEQMRMGERLRVECAITEDALLATVPPFTLQPLIENAVRHGLGPKTGVGTVRVEAFEKDGTLNIVVADDGIGADTNTLSNGGGLGLRAVRQRLEARHQGLIQMQLIGEPGKGVRISLALPAT